MNPTATKEVSTNGSDSENARNSIDAPRNATTDDQSSGIALLGEKSPGVRRIEAISEHLTLTNRCFMFFGIFLIAYAYGLDGQIRYTYQV